MLFTQALRARLRSRSPSGTFADSSHTTLCARHRPNLRSYRILHLRGGDSSGVRSRSSCRVTIVNPRALFRSPGNFATGPSWQQPQETYGSVTCARTGVALQCVRIGRVASPRRPVLRWRRWRGGACASLGKGGVRSEIGTYQCGRTGVQRQFLPPIHLPEGSSMPAAASAMMAVASHPNSLR